MEKEIKDRKTEKIRLRRKMHILRIKIVKNTKKRLKRWKLRRHLHNKIFRPELRQLRIANRRRKKRQTKRLQSIQPFRYDLSCDKQGRKSEVRVKDCERKGNGQMTILGCAQQGASKHYPLIGNYPSKLAESARASTYLFPFFSLYFSLPPLFGNRKNRNEPLFSEQKEREEISARNFSEKFQREEQRICSRSKRKWFVSSLPI